MPSFALLMELAQACEKKETDRSAHAVRTRYSPRPANATHEHNAKRRAENTHVCSVSNPCLLPRRPTEARGGLRLGMAGRTWLTLFFGLGPIMLKFNAGTQDKGVMRTLPRQERLSDMSTLHQRRDANADSCQRIRLKHKSILHLPIREGLCHNGAADHPTSPSLAKFLSSAKPNCSTRCDSSKHHCQVYVWSVLHLSLPRPHLVVLGRTALGYCVATAEMLDKRVIRHPTNFFHDATNVPDSCLSAVQHARCWHKGRWQRIGTLLATHSSDAPFRMSFLTRKGGKERTHVEDVCVCGCEEEGVAPCFPPAASHRKTHPQGEKGVGLLRTQHKNKETNDF